MLANNLTRDVTSVRLFEAGTVFSADGEGVRERVSLALGMTGAAGAASNLYGAADAPFFELKGAVEGVLGLFEVGEVRFSAAGLPVCFEAGRGAVVTVAGKVVGAFGELARAEVARRKLRQAVFVGELELAALLELPLRRVTAQEISRFQAVERDFSFIFPDAVVWGQIAGAIAGLGIAEAQKVWPVELWRDSSKHPGVYATLTRVRFQSDDHTLTEAELTDWWARIIAALEGLGGTIRDGKESA